MSKSSKTHRHAGSQSISEKFNLRKRLVEIWQDLQDDPNWKYEELSPVRLLEQLEPQRFPMDSDELVRATWFWSRRPRVLQIASYILWLLVALGLPLWLFIIPAVGVPLFIISAIVIDTEIVRSVRWRRQYEVSIDRLIRTSTSGKDSFGVDVFA
jgi:hypothetical protein